jgi:hypothetical protein
MKRAKLTAVDDLIDRFVEAINRLPREPGLDDEIPPSVRGDVLDPETDHPYFDWQIRPWQGIDWIEPVEEKLGLALPPTYRSLVARYVFPAFEAGRLLVSANTPEGVPWHEFRNGAFLDPEFDEAVLSKGYIQFANPWTWSHDPICFDMHRHSGSGHECPIVWIDHEEILCNNRIRIVEQVSPSFASFVEEFVRGHAEQR